MSAANRANGRIKHIEKILYASRTSNDPQECLDAETYVQYERELEKLKYAQENYYNDTRKESTNDNTNSH